MLISDYFTTISEIAQEYNIGANDSQVIIDTNYENYLQKKFSEKTMISLAVRSTLIINHSIYDTF
jgi:hypothetical protein